MKDERSNEVVLSLLFGPVPSTTYHHRLNLSKLTKKFFINERTRK